MLWQRPMTRRMFCTLWGMGLALLVCACALAPSGREPVPVTGKVSRHQQPVAGVEVAAYPVSERSLAGPAPYRSAPSDETGRFRLHVPPGEYYFLARGKGLFTYYGRNPVAVPPTGLGEMNLGLVTEEAALPAGDSFVETGIAGRVLHEGAPLSGAVVFVYTDLTSRLKGMGYLMAGPTDEEGFFEAALPAGTYYLLARHRQGRGITGPLQAGDFIGYFPGNPMVIREGEVGQVAIPVLEVPEKIEALAGELFGRTGIHGRVLNAEGKPVAGLRVLLYADPQMLNRPLFVSRPTGDDGRYLLSFPVGGTYYLAARDTLGGAPGPGELYGTYDGSPDHAVTIETGEIREGLDIVVGEMW